MEHACAYSSYPYSQPTEYKCDVIQRLGGENKFEAITFSLVEKLQADAEIGQFFNNMDSLDLAVFQDQFLRAVFLKTDSLNIHNYVLRRFCRLMDVGFNERHFDVLVSHLTEAIEEHIVVLPTRNNNSSSSNDVCHHDQEDDVIDDAIRIINSVRYIFEKEVWRAVYRMKEPNSGMSVIDAC